MSEYSCGHKKKGFQFAGSMMLISRHLLWNDLTEFNAEFQEDLS